MTAPGRNGAGAATRRWRPARDDGRVKPLFPPEGPRHRADGRIDVTVVYLEMAAPPPDYLPLPPSCELKHAWRPPVHFYRYLYDAVGRDWLWVERKRLDDSALTTIIHNDRVEVWLPERNGIPLGFAELDFRPQPDAVGITYFGLMQDAIGMGLGKPFLHAMLRRAWSAKPRLVKLNTCNLDHPAALPLYIRAGFTPVDTRTVVFDPRV